MRKLRLLLIGLVFICVAVVVVGPNRVPSDGSIYYAWRLESTPGRYRLVATSHPEQNFGVKNIHYHWFSKPTVEFIDEHGTRWAGQLISWNPITP